MPYMSAGYFHSLDGSQLTALFDNYSQVGYHPETEDRLFISTKDRFAGTYVLGVQGVGKSGLLEYLIHYDILSDRSVVVIDPHGDLIEHCIAQIPEDRMDKVHLLDMEDVTHPFGVNVFGGSRGTGAIAES